MFIHFGNSPASSLSPSLAIKQVILKRKFMSQLHPLFLFLNESSVPRSSRRWTPSSFMFLSFWLPSWFSSHHSLSPHELLSSSKPGRRLTHHHNTVFLTDSSSGPNCTSEGFNNPYLALIAELGQSPEGVLCSQGQGGGFPIFQGFSFPHHHGVSPRSPLTLFLQPTLLSDHTLPPPHCSLFPNLHSAYFSFFLLLTVLICTLPAPDSPTWLPAYLFLIKTICVLLPPLPIYSHRKTVWSGDLQMTFQRHATLTGFRPESCSSEGLSVHDSSWFYTTHAPATSNGTGCARKGLHTRLYLLHPASSFSTHKSMSCILIYMVKKWRNGFLQG